MTPQNEPGLRWQKDDKGIRTYKETVAVAGCRGSMGETFLFVIEYRPLPVIVKKKARKIITAIITI